MSESLLVAIFYRPFSLPNLPKTNGAAIVELDRINEFEMVEV